MNVERFHGIIAPIITPFDRNGDIDEELFRKEVNVLSEAGVHGLSPGGSTGEGAALSAAEIARLVELVKAENKRGLPIVAGIIKNSTRDAVEAGLAAKAAGADALMVTPTSYNVLVPDDDGNYEFYKTISDKVRLPIVIYNVVPQNEISTGLFSRLCEIPNVMGIKQSCGGIKAMYDKVIYCGDKGKVYAATDDMLCSCYHLGAVGAIAAILTLYPKECVHMWDCVQNGDIQTARKLQDKMYPVWQEVVGEQFPRRIKAALELAGRAPGLPRSPILPATQTEKDKIEMAMKMINCE